MAKEYFDLEDFDKLFGTEPAQNAEAPQVSESLSGLAQQLKSADNAVAYKNLNGNNIEDTTLVGESHTQNITTDQTDEYTDGVNSDLTETAPDINQQLSLSQSHNTTHKVLNETVQTKNEAHSIKMKNWQVFNQKIHTEIPTNLQQKIQVSGSSTVDTQQSQIGVQNIESETYTRNFGNLTTAGPTTVSGSVFNHSSQEIIIGGPSEEVQKMLMPACDPDEKCYLNTDAEFELAPMNLPPYETPQYTMTGVITISGHYKANNKQAAGPMPSVPRQVLVEAHLTKIVQDYFMNLGITATSEDGNLKFVPSITVSNQQGDYTFQNGAMVYQTPLTAEFQYGTETSKHVPSFESWEFDFTLSMTLAVTVTRKVNLDPNAGGVSGVVARSVEYATGDSPEVASKYPAMARAVMMRLATGIYELIEIAE